MTAYIIRRLLLVIPTVFVALSLMFVLFFLLPGDPANLIVGGFNKNPDPAVLARVKARYGLDDPIYVQYFNFWKRTIRWDLGYSFRNSRSVNEIFGEKAVNSLRLGIWAIIIEIFVGVSVGLLSAVRRYSLSDRITTIITAAASALPVFVLGFVFQYLFAVRPKQMGWPDWARLKTSTMGPNTWTFFFIPTGEEWRYLILPAVALASVGTALLARMMRGSMLEVLRADYMRTARAKGLKEGEIVLRHGLRNAMLPVVTLIGIDFGTVIGVAVLTETTFSWPGLGSATVQAVAQRDLPVLMGLVLVVVLVYAFVNLAVDVSYAWFDPRIRYGGEGGAR
jgi:ABC-type dipeptide/oligopeptide/nickel transport system permease component